MGVRSKEVPAFVLPDRCLPARGLDPMGWKGVSCRGEQQTHGAR